MSGFNAMSAVPSITEFASRFYTGGQAGGLSVIEVQKG